MDARNYAASETLKDGSIVTVRAIRPGDAGSLLEAFKSLDRESVYRRFFSPKKELTQAELTQLSDVDFSRVVAVLVTKEADGHEVLLGGGRYASDGPGSDRAEIAFMTAGDYRGLGIASLILTHLGRIAREEAWNASMPRCLPRTSRCLPFSAGAACL
jgi:GNAT superfamily N-acetyltransferase